MVLRSVVDQKPIEGRVEDPRDRNHWGMRLYPERAPVRTLYVDFDDEGPWLLYEGWLEVPFRWQVRVDDPRSLPAVLEVEIERGVPACRRLVLEPRRGQLRGQDLRGLRLPIAELIDWSRQLVARRRTDAPIRRDDPTAFEPATGFLQAGWGHRIDRLMPTAAGRRQGVPLEDDVLRVVAELYREALRDPDSRSRPALYVYEHLPGDIRPQREDRVRKWIVEARNRGFLGPAPSERRAGEERDTRTTGEPTKGEQR